MGIRRGKAYQLPRLTLDLLFLARREAGRAHEIFAAWLRLCDALAAMYDWVNGRPTILLRGEDLAAWPGAAIEPDPSAWAAVRTFGDGQALVLRDPELTTAVPLELGGLMLVTAVYCDADAIVTAQLDALPVAGWDLLPERFIADGGDYVLFDGSLSGAQIADPQLEKVIAEQHGGVIPVQIPAGSYEIEVLGPFRPDPRTELWLTRLIRAAPSQSS